MKSVNKPVRVGGKLTIEEMHQLAASRGFLFLSSEYKNAHTRSKWKCKDGHTWLATSDSIKRGNGCPECAGNKKLTIEQIKSDAISRGFECLSTAYINSQTRLEYKCSLGHTWRMTPNDIRQGYGCPKCGGTQKLTIEEVKKDALSKGFECLEIEYKNNRTPMSFKCPDGHVFNALQNSMHQGAGCPKCNSHHSQERTRYMFETLTGQEFVKNRKVLTGLELDGYCKELNVAFEYQGEQHYEHKDFFHRGDTTFEKQKERDAEKRVRCDEKSITLIEIPYTKSGDNTILSRFIYEELIARNIPTVKKPKEIKFEDFKIGKSKLAELRKIIKEKGGKLISDIYVDNDSPVKIECKHSHKWEATPHSIKGGSWCPICHSKKRKYTIDYMHELAKLKGIKCLSEKYTGSTQLLEWQCLNGHDSWKALASTIKKSGCSECAGTRKGKIEEMHKLAEKRGFECLSKEYVNNYTQLSWKHPVCGNIWNATPSSIKQGTGCPRCARKKNKITPNQTYLF